VGLLIFTFPSLYGDSYDGLKDVLHQSILDAPAISLLVLLVMALLKPLAASLTLGAGGDGGVFAPSIVAGAFLGIMFAALCNRYFGTHLILINFALVGAAATLSASIYAPFTSLVLVCNLIPNGYSLFFPILVGCIIARFFSKLILPYNVYSYDAYQAQKASLA
jgi:CIC family chloride channel protein